MFPTQNVLILYDFCTPTTRLILNKIFNLNFYIKNPFTNYIDFIYENHSIGINDYNHSFSLIPESYEPGGTINLSRIDSSTLNLTCYRWTLLICKKKRYKMV